jgi:hypothetical protein
MDFEIIALNGITGECITTTDDQPQPTEVKPDPETQRQFAAFLMGRPVSDEFVSRVRQLNQARRQRDDI